MTIDTSQYATTTAGGVSIYMLPWSSGTTATFVVTMSGSCSNMGVGIFETRPRLLSTILLGGQANAGTATATSVATNSSVEVRPEGFAIMVGRMTATETTTSTYTGGDTLTKNAQDSIESTSYSYWSGLTTEFHTNRTGGFSSASSNAKAVMFTAGL
jgi:hypothetical protein